MRILVVDDNADVRFLIERTLATDGFDAVGAPGGREALAMLDDGITAHLVILDVQMPDMDGWETLRRIRTSPHTAELPVVMCTVKGRPADLVHGWEAGCDGYIGKPFDIDDLLGLVRDVLARTPEQRAVVRAQALAEARRLLEKPA